MLIEIEGCDGVGKTTVAKMLAEKIGAKYLKFPDRSTPTGMLLDVMLREPHSFESTLFQALNVVNRLEHLKDLCSAKLEGVDVVCDRYEQSAYVYGVMDGLDEAWLHTIMTTEPKADLHVLLYMDPLTLDTQRLAGRDREQYERKGVAGLALQSLAFRTLWEARRDDPCWVVYDSGKMSAETIVSAIVGCLRG